jgi:hypothetical protein
VQFKKNGQSREFGNIGRTRHRTKTSKTMKTKAHHYTQARTNVLYPVKWKKVRFVFKLVLISR